MAINYSSGVVVDLPYPTKDLLLLTKAIIDAVDYICRFGFKYSKVEVLLPDLCHPGGYTDDLFATSQLAEASRMMAVPDQISERWGRAPWKGDLSGKRIPKLEATPM